MTQIYEGEPSVLASCLWNFALCFSHLLDSEHAENSVQGIFRKVRLFVPYFFGFAVCFRFIVAIMRRSRLSDVAIVFLKACGLFFGSSKQVYGHLAQKYLLALFVVYSAVGALTLHLEMRCLARAMLKLISKCVVLLISKLTVEERGKSADYAREHQKFSIADLNCFVWLDVSRDRLIDPDMHLCLLDAMLDFALFVSLKEQTVT